jgi:nicotinamide riboside kinase
MVSTADVSFQRNVYIIGAQCTGKTTLVRDLEASFSQPISIQATQTARHHVDNKVRKPAIITEVARKVLLEKSFTRNDLAIPLRATEMQQNILEAQFQAEKVASSNESSTWYLSDRSGLDPIVYGKLYGVPNTAQVLLASPIWAELEQRLKAGIVVLCEAGCEWLVDDGTRLMPVDLQDWMRVDVAFRELLDIRGIEYKVLSRDVISRADRVEFVKRAMESVHSRVNTPISKLGM